jgi:hypothetical protein
MSKSDLNQTIVYYQYRAIDGTTVHNVDERVSLAALRQSFEGSITPLLHSEEVGEGNADSFREFFSNQLRTVHKSHTGVRFNAEWALKVLDARFPVS